MNKVILMKGIPCAGKTTYLKEHVIQNDTTKIISTDDIREKNNLKRSDGKAVNLAFQSISSLNNSFDDGLTIYFDATNTKDKYVRRLINDTNKKPVDIECIYIVTHPTIWLNNVQRRIENKWHCYDIKNFLDIRQIKFNSLDYPTDKYFSSRKFIINDIDIAKEDISKFLDFYNQNKELFINSIEKFINKAIEVNVIQSVLPEVIKILGFNQRNKHHTLTLDKHTFRVCDNLPKSERWQWIGLLHDLGKVVEGIQCEDMFGNCSYRGHAGASTEIAICILNRFGFNGDFIDSVVSIINKHMYLPYDATLSKQKIKNINQIYDDLCLFRKADLNGK